MSTSTDTPRGARKAQTYLPEADAREQILDFAELMRELMRELEAFLAPNACVTLLPPPATPR